MSISAFGMISGGCLNLASLIGPSIFSSNFNDWVYYISGQLSGAVFSGMMFKLFLKKDKGEDDEICFLQKDDAETEKLKAN